jgi:hypothetical protein
MASLYPQSGYGAQYQNNLFNKGVATSAKTGGIVKPYAGPPKPTGSVLGSQPATNFTGGNTGGYSSGTQSLFQNAASVMEQGPQGNGPDTSGIDSAFAPALQAYSQFAGSLQSQLNGQAPLQGEDQLRADAEGAKGLYQSGLADQKQQFAQQRSTETGRTEMAVNDARRQGAEMIQGIQSKFGGSTGTGAFIGELTGRQVLQNISQNKSALQETLMHIGDAEASAERHVNDQIAQLDQQLQAGIQGLRNDLMSQIQQINMKRGELESQKGMSKVEALNQFKTQKAEVEARNAAFKQQLFSQLQNVKSQAQQLKGQSVEQFSTQLKQLQAMGFNVSSFGMNDQGRVDNLAFTPAQQDLKEVSPGASLFDPNTKQSVFTAPDNSIVNPFAQ